MVKRKIIWSNRAQIKLYGILEFYIERNKSKVYSKKLYRILYKELKILLKHPGLGIKTDFDNVYCIIIGDYMIYYELVNEGVFVHAIRDCRQDPHDRQLK